MQQSLNPRCEKRDAFLKAKELLTKNEDGSLRYVALELRRCLEAIVYGKLVVYRDWIPAGVARKWQPPQAFKALIRFEPDAESTMVVAIGPDDGSHTPRVDSLKRLGVDHRPGSKWLEKTWNKLGSFLHAAWPFTEKDAGPGLEHARTYFEGVLADLEPFIHQDIDFAISATVDFECSSCGKRVKVGNRELELTNVATCLNCNAEYVATKDGDEFIFHMKQEVFPCESCQAEIFLPYHGLKIGYTFECSGCGSGYEIEDCGWAIRRRHEVGGTAVSDLPDQN
jgi:hypothetical protein